MPDRQSLGPWSGDDFPSTVRAAIAGVGADSDLAAEVRFLGSIAKLIRRRSAQPGAGNDPKLPAIFLLRPAPGATLAASMREPMLDAGLTSLTGKVWFVSAVARSGRFVTFDDASDNDALFCYLTDQLGVGDVPAIIFDPRPIAQQLRFYRSGLGNLDDCELCELATADISIDRIFDTIDKVWKSSLMTPDRTAQFRLWVDPKRAYPSLSAERTIQAIIRTGLQVGFPTCTPRLEEVLATGRCDILLEEDDLLEPSKTTAHAMLELKVFRSFTHTGTPVGANVASDSISKGIEQAQQYAIEKHANIAALCCFDMRQAFSQGAILDAARVEAASANVAVALWFLFSSAGQYRSHLRVVGSAFRQHY